MMVLYMQGVISKKVFCSVFLLLLHLNCLYAATGHRFLSITGYDRFDEEHQEHIFKKNDGGEAKFPKEQVVEAADPAYDQTFKLLFSGEKKFNGFSGKDRLMSILNSIFYPNAGDDDLKIREIEELSNEHTIAGVQVTSKGSTRFDVVCRCICQTKNNQQEKKEVFDMEMQTSWQDNFPERLYEYGVSLRQTYNSPKVISLGFLNVKKNSPNSVPSGIVLFKINEKGEAIGKSDEVIAWIVNLKDKIKLIQSSLKDDDDKAKLFIAGNEIGELGKQWIYLLGMRQLNMETNIRGRYFVPLCEDLFPEIKTALQILSYVNQTELQNSLRDEETFLSAVNIAADEEVQKTIIKNIENAKTNKISFKLLTALHGWTNEENKKYEKIYNEF